MSALKKKTPLDVLLTASKPPLYSLAIILAAEEQLDPFEIMNLYKATIQICLLTHDG